MEYNFDRPPANGVRVERRPTPRARCFGNAPALPEWNGLGTAQARRALSLERDVGRIASPVGQALANRPLAQAALSSIPPNDCAQRIAVQLPRAHCTGCRKANDLAREAVSCNAGLGGNLWYGVGALQHQDAVYD